MKSILYFLLVALAIPAIGQGPWELKKEEAGIKAYTRDVEGIKFDEYLVETTLDATLSEVMAIFKDFEVYPDLFPGTEGIKVFLDEPDHHITYIKFDIPFPARDRDAVFDNYISYDKSEDALKVAVQCIPEKYETNSKLVRITFCEGGWEFKKIGERKLDVKHNLSVNPGGAAPAFIVNAKTVNDPIKTLKALKAMIQDEKYKGHEFALLNPE